MPDGGPPLPECIGVLICDDVEQVRALLNAIIDTRPHLHAIGEAGDGREAIAQARLLQPDVILLDLSMPVMTGFDALPELKRAAPGARIIVFSGFSADLMARDVLDQGADSYIEKGASPERIAEEIESQGAGARSDAKAGREAARHPHAEA